MEIGKFYIKNYETKLHDEVTIHTDGNIKINSSTKYQHIKNKFKLVWNILFRVESPKNKENYNTIIGEKIVATFEVYNNYLKNVGEKEINYVKLLKNVNKKQNKQKRGRKNTKKEKYIMENPTYIG